MRGPLFDLAVAESGDAGHFIPCPFPWKGHARRAGGWPKTKRAKPTSGATRHLLPEEGGRSGENYLLPSRGRGMPEEQGIGRRRKRAKPTSGATRHLLPEEGGRRGKKPFPPFRGRGDARRAGGWPKTKESRAFWHCHSLSDAVFYSYAPHHAHCIFSACSLIPVFQRSPL